MGQKSSQARLVVNPTHAKQNLIGSAAGALLERQKDGQFLQDSQSIWDNTHLFLSFSTRHDILY